MDAGKQFLQQRSRRPAFTFVEMLLVATLTAMVATAGTSLIFAITHASTQTRDLRKTKTAGHYALSRVAEAIRSSRVIGDATTTSITLWRVDLNENDRPELAEVAVIAYDAARKQLTHTYAETPTAESKSALVSSSDFKNPNSLGSYLKNNGGVTVIWGHDIETLEFTGYPTETEARIMQVYFTMGTGAEEVAFQTTASPRASADYLFNVDAQTKPMPGSTRIRRKHYSRWDGYADLQD